MQGNNTIIGTSDTRSLFNTPVLTFTISRVSYNMLHSLYKFAEDLDSIVEEGDTFRRPTAGPAGPLGCPADARTMVRFNPDLQDPSDARRRTDEQ